MHRVCVCVSAPIKITYSHQIQCNNFINRANLEYSKYCRLSNLIAATVTASVESEKCVFLQFRSKQNCNRRRHLHRRRHQLFRNWYTSQFAHGPYNFSLANRTVHVDEFRCLHFLAEHRRRHCARTADYMDTCWLHLINACSENCEKRFSRRKISFFFLFIFLWFPAFY